MGTSEWSKSEKEVARQAFTMAYDRECKSIEEELRKRVTDLQNPEGLWAIHDYLTEKRRGIDKKYDYRYSVLLFVFARLLHEGWIKREGLKRIFPVKLSQYTVHQVHYINGLFAMIGQKTIIDSHQKYGHVPASFCA